MNQRCCEESHITEIKCSTSGKSRQTQSDNVIRCINHYRLKVYGYCIGNHQDKVLAHGHDKLCVRCRDREKRGRNEHPTRNKNLLGTSNEFGLKYTSGPYKQYGKNKNATGWGLLCPYCKKEFVTTSNNSSKARSCYGCRGDVRRVSSEESSYRHLYSGVKGRQHAKLRGFDLTLEDFVALVQSNCYYCGEEPAISKGHKDWSAYVKCNGLDRVDSTRGYTKDNVVACCRICNMAKGALSREEFIAWAHRLVNHQLSK